MNRARAGSSQSEGEDGERRGDLYFADAITASPALLRALGPNLGYMFTAVALYRGEAAAKTLATRANVIAVTRVLFSTRASTSLTEVPHSGMPTSWLLRHSAKQGSRRQAGSSSSSTPASPSSPSSGGAKDVAAAAAGLLNTKLLKAATKFTRRRRAKGSSDDPDSISGLESLAASAVLALWRAAHHLSCLATAEKEKEALAQAVDEAGIPSVLVAAAIDRLQRNKWQGAAARVKQHMRAQVMHQQIRDGVEGEEGEEQVRQHVEPSPSVANESASLQHWVPCVAALVSCVKVGPPLRAAHASAVLACLANSYPVLVEYLLKMHLPLAVHGRLEACDWQRHPRQYRCLVSLLAVMLNTPDQNVVRSVSHDMSAGLATSMRRLQGYMILARTRGLSPTEQIMMVLVLSCTARLALAVPAEPMVSKHLEAIMTLLRQKDVTVARFAALLAFAFGRNSRNRTAMGQLGGVETLIGWTARLSIKVQTELCADNTLQSVPEVRSRIRLLECCIGVLWQLAFDPANAERLFKGDGVEVLADVLCGSVGADIPALAAAQTLAAEVLWCACTNFAAKREVRLRLAGIGAISAALDHAGARQRPAGLRLACTRLLMSLNIDEVDERGHKIPAPPEMTRAWGDRTLEQLMVQHITDRNIEVKAMGLDMITQAVTLPSSRVRFVQARGVEMLLSLLAAVTTSVCNSRSEAKQQTRSFTAISKALTAFRKLRAKAAAKKWSKAEREELVTQRMVILKVLQALLNLSTVPSLQQAICRAGADLILYTLQSQVSEHISSLAKRVLSNLATNGANTTGLFKAELRMHAAALPKEEQVEQQLQPSSSTQRFAAWFDAVRNDEMSASEAAARYLKSKAEVKRKSRPKGKGKGVAAKDSFRVVPPRSRSPSPGRGTSNAAKYLLAMSPQRPETDEASSGLGEGSEQRAEQGVSPPPGGWMVDAVHPLNTGKLHLMRPSTPQLSSRSWASAAGSAAGSVDELRLALPLAVAGDEQAAQLSARHLTDPDTCLELLLTPHAEPATARSGGKASSGALTSRSRAMGKAAAALTSRSTGLTARSSGPSTRRSSGHSVRGGAASSALVPRPRSAVSRTAPAKATAAAGVRTSRSVTSLRPSSARVTELGEAKKEAEVMRRPASAVALRRLAGLGAAASSQPSAAEQAKQVAELHSKLQRVSEVAVKRGPVAAVNMPTWPSQAIECDLQAAKGDVPLHTRLCSKRSELWEGAKPLAQAAAERRVKEQQRRQEVTARRQAAQAKELEDRRLKARSKARRGRGGATRRPASASGSRSRARAVVGRAAGRRGVGRPQSAKPRSSSSRSRLHPSAIHSAIDKVKQEEHTAEEKEEAESAHKSAAMKRRVIMGKGDDPLAVADEANPEGDRWRMELLEYSIHPTHTSSSAGPASQPINLMVTQAGSDAKAVTKLLNEDKGTGRVGSRRGRRASVVIEGIVAPHHVSKADLSSKHYKVTLTVQPGTQRHKFTFGSSGVAHDQDLSELSEGLGQHGETMHVDAQGMIRFGDTITQFDLKEVHPELAQRHEEAQLRAKKMKNTVYSIGPPRPRTAPRQRTSATKAGQLGGGRAVHRRPISAASSRSRPSSAASRRRPQSAKSRHAYAYGTLGAEEEESEVGEEEPQTRLRHRQVATTVQLARFEHRPGAQYCKHLFEHVCNPDGTLSHYYMHDPLYEQIPEGIRVVPTPPVSLLDILQDSFPPFPPLPQPHLADAAAAEVLDSERVRAALGDADWPSFWDRPHGSGSESGEEGQGMSALDRKLMALTSNPGAQATKGSSSSWKDLCRFVVVPGDARELASKEEEEEAKGLEHVVFASRLETSESKDLFDDPSIIEGMFEVDWHRAVKKASFEASLQAACGGDDGKREALKEVLKQHYARLAELFDEFSVQDSAGDIFALQMNTFKEFCDRCRISEAKISSRVSNNALQYIFLLCNKEYDAEGATSPVSSSQRRSKSPDVAAQQQLLLQQQRENETNQDNALVRFEFLECLVRLAFAKFLPKKPSSRDDPAAALSKLLERHVFKHCSSTHDRNEYRREKVYQLPVCKVLQANMPVIKRTFLRFCPHVPGSSKRKPRLEDDGWEDMVQKAKLRNTEFAVREERLAFTQSRMRVRDELLSRSARTLDISDFMEAVVRAADLMWFPSDEQLEEEECTRSQKGIYDYFRQVTETQLVAERARNLELPPLHDRLQGLLWLLAERLRKGKRA